VDATVRKRRQRDRPDDLVEWRSLRHHRVVGPSFNVAEFGPAPELWTAFQLDHEHSDQGHFFQAAARLKPGVTLNQAKARFQVFPNEFRNEVPDGAASEPGLQA